MGTFNTILEKGSVSSLKTRFEHFFNRVSIKAKFLWTIFCLQSFHNHDLWLIRDHPTVLRMHINCSPDNEKISLCLNLQYWRHNGEPAVQVHNVALIKIGNHYIVGSRHCRWRFGSLVINATSLIIVIVFDVSLLLLMTYQFQTRSGKNWLHGSMVNKTDKPSTCITI